MCRGEPMCSPEDVVLSNRFAKETAASYSGAHIGAPLRRRGSVALLFTSKVNWSGLFCAEMFQHAKSFPRGEGGAAPKLYGTDMIAYRKKTNVESTASFAVP